jgi:hypothetical protein
MVSRMEGLGHSLPYLSTCISSLFMFIKFV